MRAITRRWKACRDASKSGTASCTGVATERYESATSSRRERAPATSSGGPETTHLAYKGVPQPYLDGQITGDADRDRRANLLAYPGDCGAGSVPAPAAPAANRMAIATILGRFFNKLTIVIFIPHVILTAVIPH